MTQPSEEQVQALTEELEERERERGDADVIELDVLRPQHYSDLAYSKQLAEENEGKLLHVLGRGWFSWNGCRWADGPEEAIRAAKVLAHDGVVAALALAAEKKITNLAVGRCAESKIRACLKLAETDERLCLPAGVQLDADPDLLNAPNAVVDLRTGSTLEHRPDLYMTKITGAEYHPDARSDRWEQFLDTATEGDAELVAYVKRGAGYGATGWASEEVVFFYHGPGATGKTTLIEAERSALGDYAAVADFSSFLAGRKDASAASPDIARLPGVRMACASEVAPGQQFNASRLKSLTGGERITARGLYKDPFEFTPQFTLCLAANERPSIPGNDSAAWRRMKLIPFNAVIPPEERDPTVKRALTTDPEERVAVLAWIVAGAVEWYRSGLGSCAAVESATAGYRRANDGVAMWLASRCQLDPDAHTPARELLGSYERWCMEAGDEACSPKAFAAALREHRLKDKHTNSGTVWAGVRLGAGDSSDGSDTTDQESPMRARVENSPEGVSQPSLLSPVASEGTS
jgi:putative DNA primase/helicase